MGSRRLTVSRSAARKAIAAAIFACALIGLPASESKAATYSVYACTGPSSEALPNSSWLTSVDTPSQTLSFNFGANCGDLSVQAKPTDAFAYDDGAEYVFDAPAGTTISGYSLNRSATVSFPSPNPTPSKLSAGVFESVGSAKTEFDCVQVTADCGVKMSTVTRSGLALSRLSVGVQCQQVTGGCPVGSFTQLASRLSDARVDIDDPSAPVIASLGGTLPDSNAAAGAYKLDITATDVGGGVRSVMLAIDGGAPQSMNAGSSCGQPYTLRAPCPSGLVRSYDINTAAYANGGHSASVTAVDAAGNVSAASTFNFTVASGGVEPPTNGTTPTNGFPAVEQPTAKMEKPLIASSNGKAVTVEGTLTTSTGAPIAGAVLEVVSLDLGIFDAKPKSIGTVTTTSSGRFSVKVTPDGAHRISVLFKPYPSSIGTAVTSTIVREELTLSLKRSKSRIKTGGSVTLSGGLGGSGSAADGTPVEIDAKIGGSWRAVGVVEANSRGAYKWKYRFTRVKQPTQFIFRAIVRKNKTWPWPTEKSKSVKVLVA
jgi:hypothetical protein